MHRPWTRGADGAWKGSTVFEDQASVAFPIEGEFTADMTSPVEARWDVWHWKAFRTDPAGHAQDRVHVMTFKDPGGNSEKPDFKFAAAVAEYALILRGSEHRGQADLERVARVAGEVASGDRAKAEFAELVRKTISQGR